MLLSNPIPLQIEKKFCGPPNSGNGGYVCGILGKHIDGVVEVTLRKPPPLDIDLSIEEVDGKLNLLSDTDLIATAKAASLEMNIPKPPTYEEATQFSKQYKGFSEHYFPTCFVCGPKREHNDGLRIFAGPSSDKKMVASTWAPFDDLFDKQGLLKPEYYFAALDCPGAYAILEHHVSMKVLGRLTTKIVQPIRQGEKIIVIGWPMERDGRKHFSGTALFNKDGVLKAFAKAVWIEVSGEGF